MVIESFESSRESFARSRAVLLRLRRAVMPLLANAGDGIMLVARNCESQTQDGWHAR